MTRSTQPAEGPLPARLEPLPAIPDLESELRGLLAQIPPGCVATYGDLADALGDRQAALWVRRWAADPQAADLAPCHRAVRTDGALRSGDGAQSQRLLAEGAPVSDQRTTAKRFSDFRTRRPLAPLIAWQSRLAQLADAHAPLRPPNLVAGLDLAYPTGNAATAAIVVLEAATRRPVWRNVVHVPTLFPYIPGRLVFRELPGLLAAWETLPASKFEQLLAFVDGQGRLHPERAGLACGFAAATGVPTIGIGKSPLCGRPAPFAPGSKTADVQLGEDVLGCAVRATPASKPFYVSVGGGLTLHEATLQALAWLDGHRLPMPIRLADQLSRRPGDLPTNDKPPAATR